MAKGVRLYKTASFPVALALLISVAAADTTRDSVQYYLQQGGQAYTQSDYGKAVSSFKEVLKFDSANIDAIKALGAVYTEMGRTGPALEFLELALELDSTDASVYNSLALAYLARRDTLQAINYYNKAIALDSTKGNFAANLALLYFSHEDYNRTIEILKPIIPHDTANKRVNYLLGRSYLGLKRFLESEPYLQKAADLDDKNAEYAFYLGVVKDFLGKTTAAESGYKQALFLKKDYFDAWQRLGVLYIKTEQFIDAMQAFERAVALRPDDINAKVALGAAYLLNDMSDKADEIHTWLQKRDPEAAEKMIRLGQNK